MKIFRRMIICKFCTLMVYLILCALLVTGIGSTPVFAAEMTEFYRAPFIMTVEEMSNGSGFSTNSSIHVYKDYVLAENDRITLSGWLATDEGILRYEYAWISGENRTPEWETAQNIVIDQRPDLTQAGIPYPGGHSTAAFTFDICPPKGAEDGYYDVYVRAITGDGIACDMIFFSRLMYGAPDIDDGNRRLVSFTRLSKVPGSLQNATFDGTHLLMTNQSMVALTGGIKLNDFERIKITYSLSESYTAEKQALIGFKSAPDHPYGDGDGLYDLTHHITALPLNTQTTEPQTVELDLDKVNLVHHESLYLSTYLKDDVTLTIHDIEFFYRGKGYDRTAAKIHFSSDIIGNFGGKNLVDLKGVNDTVMGDVLRIEVIEETNDPYIQFNAFSVLDDYDLRLNADDYKYMVVLARANQNNGQNIMTFYLCAGDISSATEACTYSHQMITDGQWHYYLFDLSSKENWTGNINGWRFDIISGNCSPGNYMDFASIQFFRTPEAAAAAAGASLTENITPHALGMPALTTDDVEESVVEDQPMTFKEGDWFVETTTPETEPPVEPETQPSNPSVTLPQEETDVPNGTDTVTDPPNVPDKGCGSAALLSPLPLLVLFSLVIKKKNFGGNAK